MAIDDGMAGPELLAHIATSKLQSVLSVAARRRNAGDSTGF
jgi:hypothetical protein